jgi:general secretion pathway protein G
MQNHCRAEHAMNQTTYRHDAGFSLMELLVALVILALIVGLVAPQVLGYLGRARTDSAKVQIDHLKSSLALYLVDMGRYPSASEGLEALVKAPPGATAWRGPYVEDGELPADPWGKAYKYELGPDGARPRVFSLGADAAPGGEGENQDVG